MKRSGWITVLTLIGLLLVGGALFWWSQRQPPRIALDGLPPLKPVQAWHAADANRHADFSRRDGRPTQVKITAS